MKCTCAFLLVLLAVAPVRGDGGTVRLSEVHDGRRITVFTSPVPLRAGPVDVSVLVQDERTGKPILDVGVTVFVEGRAYPASTAVATNKLFQAAQFDLPAPGRWRIDVEVQGPKGPTRVGCDVEATEALPSWLDLALWIGWPVGAILLFVAHKYLSAAASVGLTPRPLAGTRSVPPTIVHRLRRHPL